MDETIIERISSSKETKVLKLNCCKIKSFPPQILELTNLLVLNIRLNNIQIIPNEINLLIHLKILDLAQNK